MFRRVSLSLRLLPMMGLLVLAGCQTMEPTPNVPLTGDPVVDGNAQLQVVVAKDRVLWEYRIAASAMRRGQFDEARAKLDDALMAAAANYGQINTEAAKSRKLFRKESDKPFVGEPHERAMANFYRAILYWRAGEPDNARALLRSAQLLDSDTQDKTYAGDYVLFDYLEGLANLKLGGDGGAALVRARASAKQQGRAIPPDYDPSANVMVFVEYGNGPTKYAGGEYGEQLNFFVEQSKVRSARLEVDGRVVGLPPYDDVSYQATTRGGRVMDHVLGNKAVFKQATDVIGDVALIGAIETAQYGRGKNADKAALGLAAVGLISKLASSATTPAADIRTWENLPQFISFSALRLEPGEHSAKLEFLDASGQVVQRFTQAFTIVVPAADTSIGARPADMVVFLSQLKS